MKEWVEMTAEARRLEWALRVVGHSSRLRLLNLLLESEPMHVGEISEKLRMPFKTASRNLKLLERAGFAISQNKGFYIYYSVRKEGAHPDNVALLALVKKAFSKRKGSKSVALLSAAMFDPRFSNYLKILRS